MVQLLFTFSPITIMLNMVLYDFNKDRGVADWVVVDDVVMGGKSDGHIKLSNDGNAVFYGSVSLDNNGGFSSARHAFDSKEIAGKTLLLLRLKGDGKRYQFRIKSDKNDRHSYVYYFETTEEWQTIQILLKDMKPTFRGRNLDMPNYPAKVIEEIAFLIANTKAETFRLEIDSIKLQ